MKEELAKKCEEYEESDEKPSRQRWLEKWEKDYGWAEKHKNYGVASSSSSSSSSSLPEGLEDPDDQKDLEWWKERQGLKCEEDFQKALDALKKEFERELEKKRKELKEAEVKAWENRELRRRAREKNRRTERTKWKEQIKKSIGEGKDDGTGQADNEEKDELEKALEELEAREEKKAKQDERERERATRINKKWVEWQAMEAHQLAILRFEEQEKVLRKKAKKAQVIAEQNAKNLELRNAGKQVIDYNKDRNDKLKTYIDEAKATRGICLILQKKNLLEKK
ncbi:hypothetical protein AGMMS49936_05940 [Endomicrobiia bacterium]|nr:hypothetical protein AGMMS49936_05940 [Endomicrobiia bacterium]